jgi:ribosomal protein L37AE/L43A
MSEQTPAYTEVCPRCQGEIKILYSWGVWSCAHCKIKITQSKEAGITKVEPLMVFGISPLERQGKSNAQQ